MKNFLKRNKPVPKERQIYLSPNEIQSENPRNVYSLYTTEFSGLNGTNVHYYMECARRNLNFWKSLLFEEIKRRDLRIASVCQTRKLSVANKEWTLDFPDDTVDENIINIYKDFYSRLNITNLLTDIVEAQIQGVSIFEINWDIVGNYILPSEIKYIQNHLLCYDDINDKYKFLKLDAIDAMKLRSLGWDTITSRMNLDGLTFEVDERKLLEVHSLDGNEPNGFRNGCVDSLIWAYLFKSYGLKDWAVYVERFATPAVVGKYPPLMNERDKAMFIQAINNYGRDFKLTIPKDAEIDFPGDSGKSNSSTIFDDYISYWDTKIAERVLGQSLTTQASDRGRGSYALGQVHRQVEEDLQFADMKLCIETMNALNWKVAQINNFDKYPLFYFIEQQNLDFMKQLSEIIRNLALSGWQVSQKDIEEQLDMKVYAIGQGQNQAGRYIKEFTNKYIKFINER